MSGADKHRLLTSWQVLISYFNLIVQKYMGNQIIFLKEKEL